MTGKPRCADIRHMSAITLLNEVTRMHTLMKAITIKTFLMILSVMFLCTSGIGAAFASSAKDFTDDEMYQSYEDGFKEGRKILKKEYRDTSLLDGCIRMSDHRLWKNQGYDEDTAAPGRST